MNMFSSVKDHPKSLVNLYYIVSGSLLLYASSKILIPIGVVPITLQPTAVLLLSLTYSPFRAFSSVALWIVVGALGAPVFSSPLPGNVVLLGPTAGYIVSYLFVSSLIPWMAQRINPKKQMLKDLLLATIATCINFGMGVFVLSFHSGLEKAVQVGLLPFIVPGIIKGAGLCLALKACRGCRGQKP